MADTGCPAESVWEVCLPNYERTMLESIYANDERYMLRDVTAFGTCTIHEAAPDPWLDPDNPFPWFPDFDPTDPFAPFFPDHNEDDPGEEPTDEEVPSDEEPPSGYHIW